MIRQSGDDCGQGFDYRTHNNYKEDIKYHNQHLNIAKELGDMAGEGRAYGNLGNAYRGLGDFQKAVKYHNQALSIAKELGDRAGEGRFYGNLGNTYQSLGDFKQAVKYHNQRLSIAKELGDMTEEGSAYGNLGNTYHSLGELKQAVKYHNQALIIAKELGDRAGEGRAYGNLGNAYQNLGDFKEAVKYHNQRLSIANELGDMREEGGTYGNLGIAYRSLGDFKQAVKYHNQALSIAQGLGDRAGEGGAYANLGIAYRNLGDLKQAVKYHSQHLSIAKELGDRTGEGRAYGNLGTAYHNLGEFKQAVKYHSQDLSIAKELGDRAGEGRAYGNLGIAYDSLGNFKQAVKYHNQYLSIVKELGDRAGEGRAYCNLGISYKNLGDFKEAVKYHNQYLSVAKELGDRAGEGRAYGNLGIAYNSLGDFKEAVKYHNQRLSIAKELGERAGEGRAYGNLGHAYASLGDYQQAIKYHKQALSIAKDLKERVGEALSCYALGNDFELYGTLQVALDYYRSSVKLSNDTRALLQSEDDWKISFRNSYRKFYTALWRILLRLQKTDEALCVVEQGRAQALEDLIMLQYDSELLTIGSREGNITIASMASGIFTKTLFLALESTKIHFWVLNKESDVQYRRKEINGEDAVTFLQCVRKDVLNEYKIEGRVACENRSLDEGTTSISPSREVTEEREETIPRNNNSLRFFHDCIIAPIEDLLEGDELIIVPDGPLCLAPYAAFLDDKFRYLSESFKIRILPSLTTLNLIGNSPQDYHRSSGALLVGDPCVEEFRNEQGEAILSPLPYAREEVKSIGEMLDVVPLTGKKATKEEVLKRIGSVALVHIAAHGNMETGEIALAPNPARASKIPEEKDFILKIADVRAAKLRARLVVLSCCHSAQGEVTPEGVVGIARSFLGAGARSVLVSLWAIDDEATMEFMRSFYRDLSLGCSASVAVHQAMKCLRESEKFSEVKHWAPFVLVGDDVTIEFEK